MTRLPRRIATDAANSLSLGAGATKVPRWRHCAWPMLSLPPDNASSYASVSPDISDTEALTNPQRFLSGSSVSSQGMNQPHCGTTHRMTIRKSSDTRPTEILEPSPCNANRLRLQHFSLTGVPPVHRGYRGLRVLAIPRWIFI